MKRVLFTILFFVGVGASSLASGVTALDDNFFSDSAPNSDVNGVQVLNPDFFRKSRGDLENAPGGQFGCTSVWAKTPKAESGAVGVAVQNFCSGEPQVRWVPDMKAWRSVPKSYNNNNLVGGYYQICCVKKSNERQRKFIPFRR